MWCCYQAGVAILVFVVAAQTIEAVKLKIRYSECLTHHFEMYEPFYGSFVAQPDVYYHTANYQLVVTSPSGTRVHESHATTENKFHLVPYETGRYKFCITLADSHHARYISEREVMWDLYVGHADHQLDHAKEHDAQSLWHYVHMVDAQLQQLRSTMSYLYWRERRHRTTVESTNKRVLNYAVARAVALVLVSVAQVLGIRYLFRTK